MRNLLIFVAALAALAVAIALYLVFTTPHGTTGVAFPLSPAHRAMLARVPASADTFALIPSAGSLRGKLDTNPVVRSAMTKWTSDAGLPKPWMIGNADLVVWHSGKQTTYFLRLDPVRAALARLYRMFSAGSDETEKTRILIDPPSEEAIGAADLDRLLQLTAGLPAGDALVVQRTGSRSSYPPTPRPAVSSVKVTATDIFMTTRAARSTQPAITMPLRPRFARSAILTAAFAAPSRAIEDMNRLVGARASTLLRDGGTVVLYEVDANKLLPRPREVIVLPATPERRASLQEFAATVVPDQISKLTGFRIETAETPTELLVAFERPSIDRYLKDAFDPGSMDANAWSIRVDPQKAIPMLQQVAGAPGLRYIAPRLFRSARDLGDWLVHLQSARYVEAADSVNGDVEELRVRISN